MAGRKMTPTALKLIRGNPGHRALPENEPKLKVKAPAPPRHLNDAAKKHWRVVVKQLEAAGVMTDLDVQSLALYCEIYAQYRQAQNIIDADGPLCYSADGTYKQHPAIAIVNKKLDQMKSLLVEFGMTPSSRTKVTSGKAEEDDGLMKITKKRGRKPKS